MSMNKNVIMVAGVVALVGLSYFGLGAYNKESLAQAEPGKAIDLSTEKAKLGYTIGAQIGRDLAQSGMGEDINLDALSAAINDAVSGADSQMTDEEMMAAQQSFQLKRQEEYAAIATTNATKSAEFLESNKAAEGVKTTDSGLQYVVLREGKGNAPTANDTVSVHYAGSLIDGTTFDSSYERNQPAEFPVNGVIPGFSEGLMLMKEGAKYRFTIPADQAYGERAPESIGPNQALVFEVELLDVLNRTEPAAEKPAEGGE